MSLSSSDKSSGGSFCPVGRDYKRRSKLSGFLKPPAPKNFRVGNR